MIVNLEVTSIEISIFRKIYYTALWMFLINDKLQLHEPWNYGSRAFYDFRNF